MANKFIHIQNLNKIFHSSVESVRPVNLLTEANNYSLKPQLSADKQLVINIQGKAWNITGKRCHVVGFGKAVLGMAVQVERALSSSLRQGILSIPFGSLEQFRGQEDMQLRPDTCITIMEGAPNNQPDVVALEAAIRIKHLCTHLTSNDFLFVLISGGGSALLPLPKPPLKLADKMQLIMSLAHCGANIEEMNAVRIALSDIKGGRLAEYASNAAAVISLVISDIVNDPVELVASGPTSSVVQKKYNAKDVLIKYNLWITLPVCVQKLVDQSSNRERLTKENKAALNNYIYVVGNNRVATAAAVAQSLECGYNPFIASTDIQGEVQHLVQSYVQLLHNIRAFQCKKIDEAELKARFPFDPRIFQHFLKTLLLCERTGKPLLLVLAGEPTINVSGTGIGGRNQELALRMALAFYEQPEFREMWFLSAGTDGFDGPTPAAGAVASSYVIEQYLSVEDGSMEDLHSYLQRNDSYSFYSQLKTREFHVITGHTGTNVMDLQLLLVL